mgnify:CR=1 FL=1
MDFGTLKSRLLATIGRAPADVCYEMVTADINQELLDDAFIENTQALEMSRIYANIQSDMMATFTSVISNNLNVVMKKLTLISIILMIPTLIASFFGMNVQNGLENEPLAIVLIIIKKRNSKCCFG